MSIGDEVSTGAGLRCRWNGRCEARFLSDGSVEAIRDAAATRDEHEMEAHGYLHVVVKLTTWSYQAKFSKRGRSLRKDGKLV